MSKSIPYQILPSLFCDPSTLYIVIEFCRGDGSSPTSFAHSKSMKQLVQPESTRAFVVAPLPVLRASKCTWMANSHGTCFSVSFLGILVLAVSASTLSFSSAPIQVCLCCRIVYLGILTAGTGMERGLGQLLLRHQFRLTGPHLQNPVPQQEPSSLSHTAPSGLRAMQSHFHSPQHCVSGFPQHRPATSGSVGMCLVVGTLSPCGQLGHIRSRYTTLQGHGCDPPPWHHQDGWDMAWWEGQGCRPVVRKFRFPYIIYTTSA